MTEREVLLADIVELRRRLAEAQEYRSPYLPEICKALGWQGGTVHEVIREAEKMRKEEKRLAEVVHGLEAYIKELQNGGAALTAKNDELEARLMIKARNVSGLRGELEAAKRENEYLKLELDTERENSKRRALMIAEALGWNAYTFPKLLRFIKAAANPANRDNAELAAAIEDGKTGG